METSNYKDILKSELSNRKIVNPSYSMRAFARDLGLAPAILSAVLNGKKGLSVNKANELATNMKLSDDKKALFIQSAGAIHSRSKKDRADFSIQLEKIKSKSKQFNEIGLEYFKVISDWYHFAILELTYLESFTPDYQWIANTLSISKNEVSEAINRLLKLDLLVIDGDKWIDQFKFLVTPDDTPSDSLKKYHAQLIQKSVSAIYEQNIMEREYGTHVLAIDQEQLPEFKKNIRDFRQTFEKLASNSKTKTHVYCLGVQFFNLSTDTESIKNFNPKEPHEN